MSSAPVEQIRKSAKSLADEGKVEEAFELLVSALEAVMRTTRELELLVLKLRRERVGKSSERVDPDQLQLLFEQLLSQDSGKAPELDREKEAREDAELEREIEQEQRKSPPGMKPRRERVRTRGIERQVHTHEVPEAERSCPRCGGPQERIGQDIRGRLEYIPGRFIEHEYELG
ncbi:MAG: IS66 family transposase zinc-finger binding domain-containing protein, partial [Vicinamibacteria bacterium]